MDNSVVIVPKDNKFLTTVPARIASGWDQFELDPFATVQIISKVKLPYLSSQRNIGDRFYVVKVPALYLRMLEDKATNKSSAELAGVAIGINHNIEFLCLNCQMPFFSFNERMKFEYIRRADKGHFQKLLSITSHNW